MGLVQKHRQSQGAKLSDSPGCHHARRRAFLENSDQGVNSEGRGKQKRRVVSQQAEVDAKGKGRHPCGGVSRESFIQKIQRARQECQKQSVLPNLRSEQNHGREQGNEEKTNQTRQPARNLRQPFVEHPTKNHARDHRRQTQPQLRSAERTPEVKQEDEQRGMRGGKTRLVGKGQRDLIGQAEVESLVAIEKYSGGRPEASQQPEQHDQECRQIRVAFKPRILAFRQRPLSSRIISSTLGKGPEFSGSRTRRSTTRS